MLGSFSIKQQLNQNSEKELKSPIPAPMAGVEVPWILLYRAAYRLFPATADRKSSQAAAVKSTPSQDGFMPISANVVLGEGVKIFQPELVNLYGCTIGDQTKIGAFVEIQKNAAIGSRCKISSHSFICEGVTIEDDVFVGHGVMFTNDPYPRATQDGRLQTEDDWKVVPTRVKKGASIGSGAVVLAGITIGEGAMVGAGAVVTHDVPPNTVAKGVPARAGRKLELKAASNSNSREEAS